MNDPNQQRELYQLIEKKERKSFLSSILAVLLLLILGLSTLYFGLQAQKATRKANAAAADLELLNQKAKQDSVSSENAKQVYIDSIRNLNKRIASIDSLLKNPTGVNAKEEIRKVIQSNQVKATPKQIIYLHTYGDQATKAAKVIAGELKSAGLSTRGTEQIKTPFVSRITYFHKEDAALAQRISKIVITAVAKTTKEFDASQFRPQLSTMRAPYKQVEVWLNFEPIISKYQLDVSQSAKQAN